MKEESCMSDEANTNDQIIINEVQLILAEKRTSLSVLRTGIAVLALPLSVLSVLIATSKYYDVSKQIHFIIPLLIICFLLVSLGLYFIYRSFRKIRDVDHKIQEIKIKRKDMKDIIEYC